ncbi:hypothetical protein DRQ11_14880, partial [candidate division KSB1 bacterium]
IKVKGLFLRSGLVSSFDITSIDEHNFLLWWAREILQWKEEYIEAGDFFNNYLVHLIKEKYPSYSLLDLKPQSLREEINTAKKLYRDKQLNSRQVEDFARIYYRLKSLSEGERFWLAYFGAQNDISAYRLKKALRIRENIYAKELLSKTEDKEKLFAHLVIYTAREPDFESTLRFIPPVYAMFERLVGEDMGYSNPVERGYIRLTRDFESFVYWARVVRVLNSQNIEGLNKIEQALLQIPEVIFEGRPQEVRLYRNRGILDIILGKKDAQRIKEITSEPEIKASLETAKKVVETADEELKAGKYKAADILSEELSKDKDIRIFEAKTRGDFISTAVGGKIYINSGLRKEPLQFIRLRIEDLESRRSLSEEEKELLDSLNKVYKRAKDLEKEKGEDSAEQFIITTIIIHEFNAAYIARGNVHFVGRALEEAYWQVLSKGVIAKGTLQELDRQLALPGSKDIGYGQDDMDEFEKSFGSGEDSSRDDSSREEEAGQESSFGDLEKEDEIHYKIREAISWLCNNLTPEEKSLIYEVFKVNVPRPGQEGLDVKKFVDEVLYMKDTRTGEWWLYDSSTGGFPEWKLRRFKSILGAVVWFRDNLTSEEIDLIDEIFSVNLDTRLSKKAFEKFVNDVLFSARVQGEAIQNWWLYDESSQTFPEENLELFREILKAVVWFRDNLTSEEIDLIDEIFGVNLDEFKKGTFAIFINNVLFS